ncbi:MAG: HWE histidine kinase domain-containing protein [Pseudomonadota bacterium]
MSLRYVHYKPSQLPMGCVGPDDSVAPRFVLNDKDLMIEDPHLHEDVRKALTSGETVAREVCGKDGMLYDRHVAPYKSDPGGVIVTYKPVTPAELPDALEYQSKRVAADRSTKDDVVQSLTMGVTKIGVWTIEPASATMDWDRRFREITRLDDSNFPPSKSVFTEHIFEEDRASFEGSLEAVTEAGASQDIELRYCPPGEAMIWLQVRSVRVRQNGSYLIVGIIADITERKGNKERSDFMMRELDHRVKNLLAIILSIAEITARSNNSIRTYKNDFRGRLESMARTHNLLAQTQWSSLDLRMLVEEEIHSLAPSNVAIIEGPKIEISPVAAQSLAMFIHELMVNALKHGALSGDQGRITVSWDTDDGSTDMMRLVWEESGGPQVSVPNQEGFGGKVINRIVKRQLDADVATDWHTNGIILTALIPLASIVPASQVGVPAA